MPKRKITLEEAYAAFEQHGLEVEVKAIQQTKQAEPLSAFLEHAVETQPPTTEEHKSEVKITLYAAHTIGNGGEMVMVDGKRQVINNGIQQYGPGVCTVPSTLASHLLHQDLLARRADDRMLENKVRTYIVRPMRVGNSIINVARHVSNDNTFDINNHLRMLGEGGTYILD